MEDPTNLMAVLGAAVIAFIIGMLWYGPVFGKVWMRLKGITPEGMKSMKMSGLVAMGFMAVLTLIMMYVLAHGIVFGIAFTGMGGIAGGMVGAFWYWLGFAVPFTSSSFLWEDKSWKLWAFDAAFYFVTFMIAGALFGAFPA